MQEGARRGMARSNDIVRTRHGIPGTSPGMTEGGKGGPRDKLGDDEGGEDLGQKGQ